jgi:hypothetical protein
MASHPLLRYLVSNKKNVMKKWVVPFVLAALVFSSCRVEKPYYETSIGKKKQKYFNSIQYGAKNHPKMKF